jgi:phenylacetate-coenzyme A ligase PaaK-like adenylate-forming protein
VRRLALMLTWARAHSSLYQGLYRNLPPVLRGLNRVPPVTKTMLMARFDEWVTDPQVTWAGLAAFVAARERIGQPYRGRFAVWTTSGTTGTPGLFVHDGPALQVYLALLGVRAWLPGLTAPRLWQTLRARGGAAMITATAGHFAGAGMWTLLHQLDSPRRRAQHRLLSVLLPLPEMVQALNACRPALLIAYPTALALLAQEQEAGRLAIQPTVLFSGGEWLSPTQRAAISSAFACPLRDVYAASEFFGIASTCAHGTLHVNDDWVILEPVDRQYRPVPPGQPSATVLLTNLANRVQPLLRYDLGDSVTVLDTPCPCGSPLTAVRVEGRHNDVLYLPAAGGAMVALLPEALVTLLEETPGVLRFQLIQTGATRVSVRLEVAPGPAGIHAWEATIHRLQTYLGAQGVHGVSIERTHEPPARDPTSGKFRQVWAALRPAERDSAGAHE